MSAAGLLAEAIALGASKLVTKVNMGVIIFEAVFFPIIIVVAILAGRRARTAQIRRLAEYRKSPDSKILRLND